IRAGTIGSTVKKLLVPAVALIALSSLSLTACGSLAAPAATVNGQKIEDSSIQDELRTIRDNTEYRQAIEQSNNGQKITGKTKDSFDPEFAARLLTLDIFYQLVHDEVGKRNLKIASSDLTKARDVVEQQVGGSDPTTGQPDTAKGKR